MSGVRDACVACSKKFKDPSTGAPMNEAFWHPTRELSVQICGGCATHVRDWEIEKDATGADEQCRLCHLGGNLVLCSTDGCNRGFCFACLERLFGTDEAQAIEKMEPWTCLLCELPAKLKANARKRKKEEDAAAAEDQAMAVDGDQGSSAGTIGSPSVASKKKSGSSSAPPPPLSATGRSRTSGGGGRRMSGGGGGGGSTSYWASAAGSSGASAGLGDVVDELRAISGQMDAVVGLNHTVGVLISSLNSLTTALHGQKSVALKISELENSKLKIAAELAALRDVYKQERRMLAEAREALTKQDQQLKHHQAKEQEYHAEIQELRKQLQSVAGAAPSSPAGEGGAATLMEQGGETAMGGQQASN